MRQRAEAEICQARGPALCLGPVPLHVLQERWEEARGLRQWDAFGEGSRGMAQWGSTWAFLPDVSDVHAVVLSWVCDGEKVPSVYPIS